MNRLVIDTAALRKNIAVIRKQADGTPVYAVVKGNGYGLGLVPFAKLLKEEGINHFAVTETADAAALRKAGLTDDEILMLTPVTDEDELKTLIENDIILTISSNNDAVYAAGVAEEMGVVAAVHIKLDTGMGRYGFYDYGDVASIYRFMQPLAVCGIYSHFHSAFSSKKATEAQYQQFCSFIKRLNDQGFETGTAHIANSSALFRHPDMKLDAVRVGSAFLGRLSFRGSFGLTKIGWAESPLTELRFLQVGSSVGYGAGYKVKKSTRIAVLPIGWYHGFGIEKGRDLWRIRDCIRGCLSLVKAALTRKKLYVTVNGKKARVLGHIGMVNTVIDVTNIDCAPGDMARLEINPLLAKGIEVEYR
ncbi:MAG: alanine racemase [Ruminococcaceae bacterium]|nr:alanine racemase [Oscillospiraceae bacterium]